MKRIFKGPWLWIVLSAFAVLLAIQFLAPSDGYDEVDTSTLASYIDDGKVDEIEFNGADFEIQATLDKGTREDGDKVVAQYIDGQQEQLARGRRTSRSPRARSTRPTRPSRSRASSARCSPPCCPSR